MCPTTEKSQEDISEDFELFQVPEEASEDLFLQIPQDEDDDDIIPKQY